MTDLLLELENVTKRFPVNDSLLTRLFGEPKYIEAVNGVSLSIEEGETLALVGESGSGKSTIANVFTGLHAPTRGVIRYDGESLGPATERDTEVLIDIGMVFQNPKGSLDPRMTVEGIIEEPMKARGWSRRRRKDHVRELIERVNLSESYLSRHPHELSGGEAQRVAIGRAIALEPRVLVLDEPVSALDVSIQAQILNLLMELQDELGLTYLFIAHDLNVVEHIADRIAVMYLGELMEVAPTEVLFERPAHPYTKTLLSAIPSADPTEAKQRIFLGNEIPSPMAPPLGCVFNTRCPLAEPECREQKPDGTEIGESRSWCHFADSFVDEPELMTESLE